MPAAQVRQYSYRLCAKKDKDDIRRESVGAMKQSNHGSSVLSQQAPLVAQGHLLDVVRKVGRSERSKGKLLSDFKFKSPQLRREKVMTSLLLPSQKTEEGNQRSFAMRECNSSEIGLFNHKYQHRNDICTQKCPKANKRDQEAKSRHPGSTNYDDIKCDVIVAGNGDVTRPDLSKPIARKRYVQRKRSLIPSEGSFKSSLRICSRTFTFIALLLATVISVSGGLVNIRLSERKSTVGNSFKLLIAISWRDSLFLSILRKSSANILGIDEGLCLCMMVETSWNNNKRLIRHRGVLHNTRIRYKGAYVHPGYSHRYPGCHGYAMPIMQSFARIFLAGKRLVTYIFPFADLWASCVFYLDTYIVILNYDGSFTVFYRPVCVYIYIYIYI